MVCSWQQWKRPPISAVYINGKPYDRLAMHGPVDQWHKGQGFYRGRRGERVGLYRPTWGNVSLPVLHDAVMAYRLGDRDYLKFGHFVFAA